MDFSIILLLIMALTSGKTFEIIVICRYKIMACDLWITNYSQHVEGMVQTKIFWQSYKLCIFWSIFPYGITCTIQKNPHLVLTFSDFFKLLFESNRWFAYNEILIWAVLSSSTVDFFLKSHLVCYFLMFEPYKTKKIQKKIVSQFLIFGRF